MVVTQAGREDGELNSDGGDKNDQKGEKTECSGHWKAQPRGGCKVITEKN